MSRSLSCYLILSCLMILTPFYVYAANDTLTTYYPAPQGNYDKINANTLTVATSTTLKGTTDITGNTTLGTANGTNTTQINGTANVSGNTILGTNGINTTQINGAATVSNGLTVSAGGLGVNAGGISIKGNANLGTINGNDITTINGNTIVIGNVVIGPNEQNPGAMLEVQGNTNFKGYSTVTGSGPAFAALTINPFAPGVTALNVNGAATFNGGATVTNGTLDASGVTLKAGINNLTFCSSPNTCGIFQVQIINGKAFAVVACVKDADCPNNENCVNGICNGGAPVNGNCTGCTSVFQCGPYTAGVDSCGNPCNTATPASTCQSCISGFCATPVQSTNGGNCTNCSAVYTCGVMTYGTDSCGNACTVDGTCSGPCTNNVCTGGGGGTCTSDTQCKAGNPYSTAFCDPKTS